MKLRDETKVQIMAREIWAIICGMPYQEMDDSFLGDLEDGTSQGLRYVPEDYRIIAFNCLKEFRGYGLELRDEIDERDRIINYLVKKLEKIRRAPQIDMELIDECIFEGELDVKQLALSFKKPKNKRCEYWKPKEQRKSK